MPTNNSPRSRNAGARRAQISRSRGVRSVAFAAPPRTMLERNRGCRHPIDRAGEFAVDQDDALVACLTSGRKRWITTARETVTENMSEQRTEIHVCGMMRNTAAPPWPCSGFITTARARRGTR